MRQIRNPPNPYAKYSAEFLGEPPPTKLEVFEETATKSMISKSWSTPFGSRKTVNCYRGCIHACTYCFARQYHEFLGYGAGTDFETKIVAKINAPEVLKNELKRARKVVDHLEFSFATDPYLPLEANYRLTRRCLEVCRDFRIPVSIITKSPLVTRDVDILREMRCAIYFSIPFPTVEKSKPFELYTPIPEVRFRAMKTLTDAGIKAGIGISPVILGYNESDIPILLEKARENGASKAFMGLIHFDTDSILEYFLEKLHERLPTKAAKILSTLKRERDGHLRHRNFKERNTGKTAQWEAAVQLFNLHFKRLGFEPFEIFEREKTVSGESKVVQPSLF